MVGHPKHIPKALDNGADLICAQGGEGGGHTGDVPLSVLIPEAARLCEAKDVCVHRKASPAGCSGRNLERSDSCCVADAGCCRRLGWDSIRAFGRIECLICSSRSREDVRV